MTCNALDVIVEEVVDAIVNHARAEVTFGRIAERWGELGKPEAVDFWHMLDPLEKHIMCWTMTELSGEPEVPEVLAWIAQRES